MITRRTVLSGIATTGACALASTHAWAQAYPSRAIKFVVPFAPGGVDVTARVVGERVSAALGQPVVVENRPGGAGGSIGAKSVATAEPDGYTLLFSTPGPVTIGPAINRNTGYQTRSFTAVALVSSSPLLLVVHPSLPVRTVPELIAYAKANVGAVHFCSPGYGTQPHLLGELLKIATGAPISHIPYRGSTPAITDLIAGQVQMYFDNVANLLQYVQGGQLRAIALTSDRRDPKFPDLPTMAESGINDFVVSYWNGVLAPAGTPTSVVTKLHGVINQGLASAEMQASLRKLGSDPRSATIEEFGAFLLAENEKWAKVAKAADIKVD